jgi:hypothetical protein
MIPMTQPFKTQPWMYVPVVFLLMFIVRVLQAFVRASWCWWTKKITQRTTQRVSTAGQPWQPGKHLLG